MKRNKIMKMFHIVIKFVFSYYLRSTGDMSSDFIWTNAPDEVTSVMTKLGG